MLGRFEELEIILKWHILKTGRVKRVLANVARTTRQQLLTLALALQLVNHTCSTVLTGMRGSFTTRVKL
jgi:hypothetical protein